MIGIIPAAGKASRIHGIPKFLLPVPGGYLLDILYQRMAGTGANAVVVGTNSESVDMVIRVAVDYSNVYRADTNTMSETVLAARERYGTHEFTLFAMPDTYWLDRTVFPRLIDELKKGALVSAALFKVNPEQTRKLGMCDVSHNGSITRVIDKPAQTDLQWAWGAMAWRAEFWRYIEPPDPHVGYALQRAVERGERGAAVMMEGPYWDCGTPDEYFDCIRSLTEKVQS